MEQATGNLDLSERLYSQFAKMIYEAAGITLGEANQEMVKARLGDRVRALRFQSFEEYYQFLSADNASGSELVFALDAISTNKTFFFREQEHFLYLAETVLPALMNRAHGRGNNRIRIWSAGCSSGEEPYTIVMVLRDVLDPSAPWNARILATDLSTKVLHFAYEGLYEESKVSALPPQYLQAYFEKEKRPSGTLYRIKPEVKQMVTFRRLNLMNAAFPFSGKFDAIFCRNVLIYFDRQTQETLVNKFYDYMAPGGHLFIGQNDSLASLKTPFQFISPTIHVRPA